MCTISSPPAGLALRDLSAEEQRQIYGIWVWQDESGRRLLEAAFALSDFDPVETERQLLAELAPSRETAEFGRPVGPNECVVELYDGTSGLVPQRVADRAVQMAPPRARALLRWADRRRQPMRLAPRSRLAVPRARRGGYKPSGRSSSHRATTTTRDDGSDDHPDHPDAACQAAADDRLARAYATLEAQRRRTADRLADAIAALFKVR